MKKKHAKTTGRHYKSVEALMKGEKVSRKVRKIYNKPRLSPFERRYYPD